MVNIEEFKTQINELDDDTLMTIFTQMETDISELNAGLTEVRRTLQDRLLESGLKSKIIKGRPVVRYERVTFATTKEQADELGALETKTVQSINTKKLRALYDKGIEVPGVKVAEYVRISQEQE